MPVEHAVREGGADEAERVNELPRDGSKAQGAEAHQPSHGAHNPLVPQVALQDIVRQRRPQAEDVGPCKQAREVGGALLDPDEHQHGPGQEPPRERDRHAEYRADGEAALRKQTNQRIVLRPESLRAQRVVRGHSAVDDAHARDVDPHVGHRRGAELRRAELADEDDRHLLGARLQNERRSDRPGQAEDLPLLLAHRARLRVLVVVHARDCAASPQVALRLRGAAEQRFGLPRLLILVVGLLRLCCLAPLLLFLLFPLLALLLVAQLAVLLLALLLQRPPLGLLLRQPLFALLRLALLLLLRLPLLRGPPLLLLAAALLLGLAPLLDLVCLHEFPSPRLPRRALGRHGGAEPTHGQWPSQLLPRSPKPGKEEAKRAGVLCRNYANMTEGLALSGLHRGESPQRRHNLGRTAQG